MKKVLSVFLSILMLLSVSSVAGASYAADSNCVTVKISGTQYNSKAKTIIDDFNNSRIENGLDTVTADAQLTALAKKLAPKTLLCFDSELKYLPDGSLTEAIVPNNTAIFAKRVYSLNDSELTSVISQYANLAAIKSLGVAVFSDGKTNVVYSLISADEATYEQTSFFDESYSSNEKLSASNIKYGDVSIERVGKRYLLSTSVNANGLSKEYYSISNNEITYQSSNNKILKVKGNYAYVKNNGNVTVYAKTLGGAQIAEFSGPCSKSSYKPTISYLKSTKKKTFKVKWTTNIANADGYQIQYSRNKKFKKAKTVTIKGGNKASKTIKKLKRKKTYYVRIRAYVNQGEGETLKTPWSAKKKIKIK